MKSNRRTFLSSLAMAGAATTLGTLTSCKEENKTPK
ncbi:MAG: twin-arginine translocation signal domain-containing protein, partial [Bacteroidetes bacterium]|nr:twin-arginine translocation signal domain-containing protein [Bacteroidota bacterium]